MTTERPTRAIVATVETITDLVNSARTQCDRARLLDLPEKYADGMHYAALTLDAARTRLIQDGEEYLDAAHLLIDDSRKAIVSVMFLADQAGRLQAVGS